MNRPKSQLDRAYDAARAARDEAQAHVQRENERAKGLRAKADQMDAEAHAALAAAEQRVEAVLVKLRREKAGRPSGSRWHDAIAGAVTGDVPAPPAPEYSADLNPRNVRESLDRQDEAWERLDRADRAPAERFRQAVETGKRLRRERGEK